MNFKGEGQKLSESFLNYLDKLISIDSTGVNSKDKLYPFGKGAAQALDYFLSLAESFGFKTKNLDNMIGYVEYGSGSELVGILCHLDVVPATGNWSFPPFKLTRVGDKLYGRGTGDDKGPAMSSLFALKLIKDKKIKLNKRIRLIVGLDEESENRCIKRYLSTEEIPSVCISPDADFPLIFGEKGISSISFTSKSPRTLFTLFSGDRLNVVPSECIINFFESESYKNKTCYDEKYEVFENKVVVKGKSSHAAFPEAGINALYHGCEFLAENGFDDQAIRFIYENFKEPKMRGKLKFNSKLMGDLTVNLAYARIDEKGVEIKINVRYPIDIDFNKWVDELQNLSAKYDLTLEVIENSAPHFIDPQSKLIKDLYAIYVEYTGDKKTKPKTIGGGTYARHFKNGVAFGCLFPNRKETFHEVDEYFHLSDLLLSIEIIAAAIEKLGS